MPAFTDQYDILFKGLKTGMHHFGFDLDDDFFGHYDNTDCLGGEIAVSVEMEKKDHLLSLFFEFSGYTRVVCDRCLDEFNIPVAFQSSLFVKFGEEPENSDADVIYLEENEHKLNIGGYMIESICLSLPLRKVHIDDEQGNSTCNRTMIDKLKSHKASGERQNTDPRWDVLKNIANKYN